MSIRYQTTTDLNKVNKKNEVIRIHHKDIEQKPEKTFEEEHPECTE
jgi:hypothetical protein